MTFRRPSVCDSGTTMCRRIRSSGSNSRASESTNDGSRSTYSMSNWAARALATSSSVHFFSSTRASPIRLPLAWAKSKASGRSPALTTPTQRATWPSFLRCLAITTSLGARRAAVAFGARSRVRGNHFKTRQSAGSQGAPIPESWDRGIRPAQLSLNLTPLAYQGQGDSDILMPAHVEDTEIIPLPIRERVAEGRVRVDRRSRWRVTNHPHPALSLVGRGFFGIPLRIRERVVRNPSPHQGEGLANTSYA